MNETRFNPTTTTKYFEINEHLIWKIGDEEKDLQAPNGYYEVKTEKTRIGEKICIKKFFKNSIPVIATLYENDTTKEIGYFFEGTIVEKEKVKTI